MASEGYELLAMLMRYVFVFLGVLILYRTFRWLRKDAKNYRREMKMLPDAGLVGEMVDLQSGRGQPLPREGSIGTAGSCDIRIRREGVARRHALFAFEEGRGLRVTPYLGEKVLLDGKEMKGSGYALHGSQLQLGGALLRVRLFAGLNVPHPVSYSPDEPDTGAEDFEIDSPLPYPMPSEVPLRLEDREGPDAFYGAEPEENGIGYAGHYTEDGQMTWEYAYTLEELEQARQAAQAEEQGGSWEFPNEWNEKGPGTPEDEEGTPYQSPVPRRRRRRRS